MKSVQNTLGFLDKETVASDGKTSEETTDDGSVPTSAEIEAVKGQTDADSADENKTKEESVSGQKEDGKDEHYDEGNAIFQATCPVLPTDSPDDVAKKVHALEYEHFPQVIEQVLRNKY